MAALVIRRELVRRPDEEACCERCGWPMYVGERGYVAAADPGVRAGRGRRAVLLGRVRSGLGEGGEVMGEELCRFCGATRETAAESCPDHFDGPHDFGPAERFTGEWLPADE